MIAFILKGIDFNNPRLTRNPRLWVRYLCWCIQFWMSCHRPLLPVKLRGLIFRLTPKERHHLSWRMIEWWKKSNPDFKPTYLPLPWPICESAFGPFDKPWQMIQRRFRAVAGYGSRCDFTDRENGLLYGGEGGTIDALFGQFIKNISGGSK